MKTVPKFLNNIVILGKILQFSLFGMDFKPCH